MRKGKPALDAEQPGSVIRRLRAKGLKAADFEARMIKGLEHESAAAGRKRQRLKNGKMNSGGKVENDV